MLKTKLPVIVLRNMILLPSGEIKLEIQEAQDKNIIYKAINEHNGYVLLISPKYATMDDINKDELPKFGIIGKNMSLNTETMITVASKEAIVEGKAYIYSDFETGTRIAVALLILQYIKNKEPALLNKV